MLSLKVFIYLAGLICLAHIVFRFLLKPGCTEWIGHRFLVTVPILAIADFIGSPFAYFGSILLAVVILPRSRLEAIGLYIFLLLLLPFTKYEISIGPQYLITVQSNYFAALGLLGSARFGRSPGSSSSGEQPIWAVVMLFFIVETIIASRSGDITITAVLRNLLTFAIPLMIPFLAIQSAGTRQSDPRIPIFWFIAAGFTMATIAGFETLRHWPLYQSIESHLGITGLSKTLALRGGLLRSPGPFVESTTFGIFLATTTIFTAAMRSVFRSTGTHAFAIAVGCFGCFATLSRNSWIGLILGLIVIGILRGKVTKTVIYASLALVGAATLVIAAPESSSIASLVGKGSNHAASTEDYRRNLFKTSVPLVIQNPVIGMSYQQAIASMHGELESGSLGVDFVNSYLYFAVTSGLLGLAVFSFLVLYPVYVTWGLRRRSQAGSEVIEVAAALCAGQLAFALMVFGTSFFERIPVLAIILAAMARVVALQARSRRSTGPRAQSAEGSARVGGSANMSMPAGRQRGAPERLPPRIVDPVTLRLTPPFRGD